MLCHLACVALRRVIRSQFDLQHIDALCELHQRQRIRGRARRPPVSVPAQENPVTAAGPFWIVGTNKVGRPERNMTCSNVGLKKAASSGFVCGTIAISKAARRASEKRLGLIGGRCIATGGMMDVCRACSATKIQAGVFCSRLALLLNSGVEFVGHRRIDAGKLGQKSESTPSRCAPSFEASDIAYSGRCGSFLSGVTYVSMSLIIVRSRHLEALQNWIAAGRSDANKLLRPDFRMLICVNSMVVRPSCASHCHLIYVNGPPVRADTMPVSTRTGGCHERRCISPGCA